MMPQVTIDEETYIWLRKDATKYWEHWKEPIAMGMLVKMAVYLLDHMATQIPHQKDFNKHKVSE